MNQRGSNDTAIWKGAERLREDDYVKSQSGPISGAHTPHRCMPYCHKTSCCQSADERVAGRGDRQRVVFILHEGNAVRPKAGAATGDRLVRCDWLSGLWKLSLGAEEWSRISLLLSHVTIPCVEEYACHPSLTACLGKCNGGVWDSEGLHFSLKLHEAAWNVSSSAHQREVTSCCVIVRSHVHSQTDTKDCRRTKEVKGGGNLIATQWKSCLTCLVYFFESV